MTSEEVPGSARALLVSCLDSYEKLHIVCALSSAGRKLGLADLEQRSGLSRAIIGEALPPLLDSGLVARSGESIVYVAGDAEREAGVSALSVLLLHNAVQVALLLNALALERARKAIEARLRVVFNVSSAATGDEPGPSV